MPVQDAHFSPDVGRTASIAPRPYVPRSSPTGQNPRKKTRSLNKKPTSVAAANRLQRNIDYLVKPFEFEELLARVQALVRRTYHRKNPVLAVGPLVIDTSTQHVERGGGSLN